MKSVTVNVLLLTFLLAPPLWLGVCGSDESFKDSFDTSEPSASLDFFDLFLFFFEDILITKNLPTWTWKHA